MHPFLSLLWAHLTVWSSITSYNIFAKLKAWSTVLKRVSLDAVATRGFIMSFLKIQVNKSAKLKKIEDKPASRRYSGRRTTTVGLYSKHIFPRLLDWSLGSPEMGKYRRKALEQASGRTLEIGFGTGLNLPWYPDRVTQLTVFDSENMLPELVEKRISHSSIPVTRLQLDASGHLPFHDHSFDTVVTTFTLCSIDNLPAALSEVRRILKFDGRFIFLEHGRSDSSQIARWQDRLNPIQKAIGVGCNMNRRIDEMIREAGFEINSLDRFLMPKTPRLLAEMYRGIATATINE